MHTPPHVHRMYTTHPSPWYDVIMVGNVYFYTQRMYIGQGQKVTSNYHAKKLDLRVFYMVVYAV